MFQVLFSKVSQQLFMNWLSESKENSSVFHARSRHINLAAVTFQTHKIILNHEVQLALSDLCADNK